jgi:cytochrome c oxidase assembly protein subunit 15
LGAGKGSVMRLAAAGQGPLAVFALAGAALMLIVIVASAYLRLEPSVADCLDGPACYGGMAGPALVTPAIQIARTAHRIAASAVGLLLLMALGTALRSRPRRWREAAIALAGLAVTLSLAVLGVLMSGMRGEGATPVAAAAVSPAVTLGNLLGGFALLALFGWLYGSVQPPTARLSRTALRVTAAIALAATAVQVAVGGLVSARHAGDACPSFPTCGASGAQAALHQAHRLASLAVLLAVGVTAWMLLRGGLRHLAMAVALLLAATLALGTSEVLAPHSLTAALLHNVCAASLLCALVRANQTVSG